MSERDDQVEAQLEAMFSGTRSRRGLQDEVLGRLQARRPWWSRALEGIRRQPAALAAPMVAVLLVGGVVAVLQFGPRGAGGAMQSSTAARDSGPAPAAEFGPVPWPRGTAASAVAAPGAPVAPGAAAGAPGAAEGAATAGTTFSVGSLPSLPALPATLSVDHIAALTAADCDAYAATVQPGLQDSGQTVRDPGGPGGARLLITYSAPGLRLTCLSAAPGVQAPPRVHLELAQPAGGAAGVPETPAAALIRAGLLPDPALVRVIDGAHGPTYVQRHPAPQGPVDVVDVVGLPSGIVVDVVVPGGGAVSVDAVFPHLATTNSGYRTATADELRAAAPRYAGTGPKVDFDRAQLVYTWVVAPDGSGYLEPAVLFTSSTSPPSRLLVPAVSPQWLRG